MKRTETITKTQMINLLINHKLNKFYAGNMNICDILERCDALRFDNIPPHYALHSVHTQYVNFACDYDDELTRCYTLHSVMYRTKIQGYDAVIIIFENDSRVVYVVRD